MNGLPPRQTPNVSRFPSPGISIPWANLTMYPSTAALGAGAGSRSALALPGAVTSTPSGYRLPPVVKSAIAR